MTETRVALVLDHPQRDLAGLVLTAFELCQRGVTCHLVPLNLVEREVLALASDFVLLNFVRPGVDSVARMMTDAGIRFGFLDTEGAVWSTLDSYTELLWSDPALLQATQPACLWGTRMAEHLSERGTFSREQVRVTGCPRFDFYHPSLRPVLLGGDAASRVPRTGRILINTNFSVSNPRFATVEGNARQFTADFGWSDERIAEYLTLERCAIAGMIELAGNLARDYPGAEIVVRPHPFEDPARYARPLSALPNVIINTNGPVQPQIAMADVVIQRSCSTAIEAGLARTPALSPRWIPTPADIPMSEGVSVPCDSYEAMRESLDAILAGGYHIPASIQCAIDTVIRDWFCAADGRAHERVADAVMSVLGGERTVNEQRCARVIYDLGDAGASRGRRLAGMVRYRLGLSPDWSFRHLRSVPSLTWSRTDKYFGVDEVRVITDAIRDVYTGRGVETTPVTAVLARDRGDYLRHRLGFAVTMACEARGG